MPLLSGIIWPDASLLNTQIKRQKVSKGNRKREGEAKIERTEWRMKDVPGATVCRRDHND